METKNLKLIPEVPDHLRALIQGPEFYEKKAGLRVADGMQAFLLAASPDFLARLQTADSPDPWTFGFAIVLRTENTVIGSAGYKGPPGADRVVEIAYGIAPAYQGRGYATEAALALVAAAFATGRVAVVRAHTLPTPNASTRVLEKCGFRCTGGVIDPEDGMVWRWERHENAA